MCEIWHYLNLRKNVGRAGFKFFDYGYYAGIQDNFCSKCLLSLNKMFFVFSSDIL